jgi:hypothetical protein
VGFSVDHSVAFRGRRFLRAWIKANDFISVAKPNLGAVKFCKIFATPEPNTLNKIAFIRKRLANPRVRTRLKIGLFIYGSMIMSGVIFKIAYDIGYFDAQALKKQKDTEFQHSEKPALTLVDAQRIVTGALKEDPTNPKTRVVQIIDDDPKLSTIVIENNKLKKIGWIIDRRLFFFGDLFNDAGYNLADGIKKQYNIDIED